MQIDFHEPGSIARLGQIIKKHQAKKIFAVTGRASFAQSGAARALEKHVGSSELIRFFNFDVNPKLEDVLAGIDLLKQTRPDMIIAVGGGSAMDMGKLIAALAPHPPSKFVQIIKTGKITRKRLPLVAIPTTAGSGSEATHFAVVYIENQKYALDHPSILPDYAIVDADLTAAASPTQAAASGMDALSQAVESYWSVNATDQSQAYASRAIQMILPAIQDAVNLADKPAQQAMALGANLAGKAINITTTTAPHAISYALTTHHGIVHGHAVALILGKFFQINEARLHAPVDERGSNYITDTLKSLYGLFGCNTAQDCSKKWYELMGKIGLPTHIPALGIQGSKNIARIIDNVNPERLKNHPVLLRKSDLARIFE